MKDHLIVIADSQNLSFLVDVLQKICFREVKTTPTELNQKLCVGVDSSIVAEEPAGRPQQIMYSLKHDDTKSPIPPLAVIHTEHSAECAELWADLSTQRDFLLLICDPAKLHEKILSILLEILKRPIQRKRVSVQNAMVRNAITFISENLQRPISSRDVANHVCLSRNHFAVQFKMVTGSTPSAFINRLRIDRAKKLIIEKPHWSFKIVAEHCGFSDAYYFSKIFKDYTSQSPRDFKQAVCRAPDELSATGVIEQKITKFD